jgi:hypothetical protein
MSVYVPHIPLREARVTIATHEGDHCAQDPDAAVVAIRLAWSALEASTNQESPRNAGNGKTYRMEKWIRLLGAFLHADIHIAVVLFREHQHASY